MELGAPSFSRCSDGIVVVSGLGPGDASEDGALAVGKGLAAAVAAGQQVGHGSRPARFAAASVILTWGTKGTRW